MNPIIKKQLEKCTVAEIPPYVEDSLCLFIKKSVAKNNQACLPGHYYEIRLADYLVHPPKDYPFFINWNAGRVPGHFYYRCEVQQILGKMIQITGVSFSPEDEAAKAEPWYGWLPLEGVEIIKEI